MRKRDLAILMLSAFAIFFSLQQDGDLSFKEAWFHFFDEYPIKYESERLPPPIVTDLNGDGRKEILVATHDAKIQVLDPHARRADEGQTEARLLTEVILLPDKVRVSSGRRAVAMAAGVVDRANEPAKAERQVLVVVTSGWSVMCFDHDFEKLWETNLQEDFPHNAHHVEIAISISNSTLKHGDAGLVIVGGRMEVQPHIYSDPFEEEQQQRRRDTEKEEGSVDLRHFAFYAFAGRTGDVRWTRKNEDLLARPPDAAAASQMLVPQHNYKLDAHSLNARKPGEFECREFRESILRVLPHIWDRREDTRMELAHFRRHKRKAVKKTAAAAAGKDLLHSSPSLHRPEEAEEERHSPGKDRTRRLPEMIGKAAVYARSSRRNDRARAKYVPTITNYTQLWWVPNVVVAHQKQGVEALHLATGRTLCRLHLHPGGLHADVNGDGVLDHVRVVVPDSQLPRPPCWAVATSGVPVRQQLFNVSVCRHSPFHFFARGDAEEAAAFDAASPVFVPRADTGGGDVVFLTGRGEVTSYTAAASAHGAAWQWQLLTRASWSKPSSLSGSVPTLRAVYLRAADRRPAILAAGEHEAAVISPSGTVLAAVGLPAPPTHALVPVDFSGDGLTDIIVVTSNAVYGLVQVRLPGALFFSTLVGCLIVVMAVLFVSHHLNLVKPDNTRTFLR